MIYDLTNRIRWTSKTEEGMQLLQTLLSDKQAMLYFTQPSTRTFLSFQAACHILGVKTLEIRNSSTSSEVKGESIEDSLRTFSSYADLIIMRSPVAGLCDRTAEHLDTTPRPVPIINAGSGPDEHPTQSILDIYTLMRSFSGYDKVNNKTICFVGDIKRGRTVRSLAHILCLFKDVKMIFVSPKKYAMANDLRKTLEAHKIDFTETTEFKKYLPEVDAIYMTRLQSEYGSETEKDDHAAPYRLTKADLASMKEEAVIMHPLPRREELDPAIDADPRAKYWRQERNGMWVRAALMLCIFGKTDILPEAPESLL